MSLVYLLLGQFSSLAEISRPQSVLICHLLVNMHNTPTIMQPWPVPVEGQNIKHDNVASEAKAAVEWNVICRPIV